LLRRGNLRFCHDLFSNCSETFQQLLGTDPSRRVDIRPNGAVAAAETRKEEPGRLAEFDCNLS
jgi:hypothetical protein